MPQDDRKAFEDWKTHVAYMRQSGLCANCDGTLDYGMGTGKKKSFEEHHDDGDHSNTRLDNLKLLCKTCHRATLAETDPDYKKNYDEYKVKQKEIFDKIFELLEKAINKELAGTVISNIIELLSMGEKANAELHNMNQGVFYPPPSIKFLIATKKLNAEMEAMKEGIKIGLAAVSNIVHGK